MKIEACCSLIRKYYGNGWYTYQQYVILLKQLNRSFSWGCPRVSIASQGRIVAYSTIHSFISCHGLYLYCWHLKENKLLLLLIIIYNIPRINRQVFMYSDELCTGQLINGYIKHMFALICLSDKASVLDL